MSPERPSGYWRLPRPSRPMSRKKNGGKLIPSLSKWLANGAGRSVYLPAKQNPIETAERERTRREPMSALARVEFAERIGKEPEADNLAAVVLWQRRQSEWSRVRPRP